MAKSAPRVHIKPAYKAPPAFTRVTNVGTLSRPKPYPTAFRGARQPADATPKVVNPWPSGPAQV